MVSIGMDGTAGEEIRVVSMASAMKDYKITKIRSKMLDGYPENSCLGSKDYIHLRDRSTIVFALDELLKKSKAMTYKFQSQPTRRLYATMARAKEDLCIVPYTSAIAKIKDSTSAIATAVLDGETWILRPQNGSAGVSDFFLLRQVSEKKGANMIVKKQIVQISTPRERNRNVSIVCAINHMPIEKK